MAQGSKRRGRIFILLALVIIVGVVAVWFFFVRNQTARTPQAAATPVPAVEMTSIVMTTQPIPYGVELTSDVLTLMPYPTNNFVPGVFFSKIEEVVGKRARMALDAKVPITASLIMDTAAGSLFSYKIPSGMVAVTIPIESKIAGIGYAPQEGDHVNVIATMMFVDVDTDFQSILPNTTAQVFPPNVPEVNPSLVELIQGGGEGARLGRAEQDPALTFPVYLVPSEPQRPKVVSQTILQDVVVLRVGDFPLSQPTTAGPQPTPTPLPEGAAPPAPTKPNIITLIVTPQDAVTLNYMMFTGTKLSLALRGAGDEQRVKTDAVTMQYTMDTYSIPLPAEQPYALQPRRDELRWPLDTTGASAK